MSCHNSYSDDDLEASPRTGVLLDIDNENTVVTEQELQMVREMLTVANNLLDPNSDLRNNAPNVHRIVQLNRTEPDNCDRKYLAWNKIGVITSREVNDYASRLDIHFTNTMGDNKDFHITNVDGYTLASLSYEGAIFANEKFGEEDARPNLLYYPFAAENLLNESISAKVVANERVVTVAVGKGWFAIVTSSNTLRILSCSGITLRTEILKGSIVCLSGLDTKFAVLYQVDKSSCLRVDILDIAWDSGRNKICELAKGIDIPLSNASNLIWAGFLTDWAMLCVLDSQGKGSVMTKTSVGVSGWMWSPILQLGDEVSTRYWPISIKYNCLSYITLAGGIIPQRNFNQLYPVPDHKKFCCHVLNFVSEKDISSVAMRNFVWENMVMVHLESLKADAIILPVNDSREFRSCAELDEMISTQEMVVDKILMTKLQTAIVSTKIGRAVEIVCTLRSDIALQKARQLGDYYNCHDVTEMVILLQRERGLESINNNDEVSENDLTQQNDSGSCDVISSVIIVDSDDNKPGADAVPSKQKESIVVNNKIVSEKPAMTAVLRQSGGVPINPFAAAAPKKEHWFVKLTENLVLKPENVNKKKRGI